MKHFIRLLCTALCALLLLASLSSCFLLRPITNAPETVYGSLLEEYALLLEARANGEDVTATEAPTTKGLSDELFASLKTILSAMEENEYTDTAEMGYAFYDLDRDGTYECFLMKNDGTLYALYASKNGKPYPVKDFVSDTRVQGVLLNDGSIYIHEIFRGEDGKAAASQYTYSYFSDGALEASRTYYVNYKEDSAYAIEYGERRDFADKEIHHINDQATSMHNNFRILSMESGLWFKSITENDSNPDTPTLDVSSYDAVLTTAAELLPHARNFTFKSWWSREYDSLLTVSSPEEYRICNALLYTLGEYSGYSDVDGNRYDREIGYAYKDLNGDGVDELFLLNEQNGILAVFALRENTPVLLWHAGGYTAYTALDSQGRLIVGEYANYNFTAMTYSAFELTADGELNTVAYIFGDQYVRKVMQNGRVTITDVDAYRAEYARVFKIVETDWNEGGKVLGFTPIPED